jgi:hypothetical protein
MGFTLSGRPSSPVTGFRTTICVIHDDRSVGRIRLADERSSQGVVWTWNVNPPLPIPSWSNGSADSLEAAKDQFKAAWKRVYASLPEAIEPWHRS